jgi:DDE superfamily endonuclease
MLSLPIAFSSVIGVVASVFSRPVWHQATGRLTGAVLAPGRRPVTAILRSMGLSAAADFQTYHRGLNRAVWSPRTASRLLLRLLVAVFLPRGVIVFGLDDTLERRRGEQMQAQGIYRAPGRSSHAYVVQVSGRRWLGCMVLTPIAWANRVWALPFLTVRCPSERFSEQRGRRHQPLTARAWQMSRLLVRWLPGREIVGVADSSCAVLALLDKVKTRPGARVITRRRLDAVLSEPAPHRKPGTNGRPRLKGQRRPPLEAVLAEEQTPWTTVRGTQG